MKKIYRNHGIRWNPISIFFDWLERKAVRWRVPGVGKISITNRGEEVKSIIEKRIANSLHRYHVEYAYEKPVRVWFFKRIYPDFYLPKYNLYIEYYGLKDHPTYGKRYMRGRLYKERHYKRLGLKVIALDSSHAKHIEKHLWQHLKPYVSAEGLMI